MEIAKILHEIYEQSSKIAGWQTQKQCRVSFENLPEKNKAVMIAMGHFVLGLREDFARQKCKEQREICAKILGKAEKWEIHPNIDEILNAPTPDFE